MSAVSFETTGRVPSEAPQRVLTRLCRHFAHKTPVEFTPEHGRIQFRTGGWAELDAAADALDLRIVSVDEDSLARLIEVVERHLKMVEFRETMPAIAWSASRRVADGA